MPGERFELSRTQSSPDPKSGVATVTPPGLYKTLKKFQIF